MLAKHLGATNIYLLGFDLKVTNGKKHFFGDHKGKLSNAETMNKWISIFENERHNLDTINVINCTRETALLMFPLKNLEEVINDSNN